MHLDFQDPFTTAMARAAGLGRGELAGARFQQVFRGVHRLSSTPDSPLLRGRAALLVHPPGAVLSHTSVARLMRVPVPRDPLEHVTVPRDVDRRGRAGLRAHVALVEADDLRFAHGLRVTAPHRLFLDLAGSLHLVDLVVVGDWLVRRSLVTVASLRAYCLATSARHALHARRAAALVRDRVESPMETRLRLLIVLAGLPEPVVDHELRDPHGVLLRRLDLAYPSVRVAVEYDGRHHVDMLAHFEGDAVRRDDLAHAGWRLVTVTSRGVHQAPEETLDRVWRALATRGHLPLRRPTDGYRPHFG